MAFPGMMPMQFAQSTLPAQLQGLGKAFQGLAPKPGAQPAAPAAPAPMDISPAATNGGANVPQPSLMDALKGLSPQAILERLRAMSVPGQTPEGMPGSAALDNAGMLSGPLAASGIPLNLMPGS